VSANFNGTTRKQPGLFTTRSVSEEPAIKSVAYASRYEKQSAVTSPVEFQLHAETLGEFRYPKIKLGLRIGDFVIQFTRLRVVRGQKMCST